ncbi:MAG TPA: endonuclease/exonuclease/phosphatase family protein [Patescibacteria group bacterium]|jgi:endonuclease/exonuclease/phosphatase family metal-dependent hydrolase|nr:endonuclease/exonuclease/phosphatase family protein [Patescibacteria group bacterium]
MKFKFVCLNLWRGGELMDGILDFLAKENADIVVLQEVYDGHDQTLPRQYRSIQVLQDKFHYPYIDFAPTVIDVLPVGKVTSGNAVLSRFQIKGHDVTFFNEPFGERDANDPKTFPITPRNLQHVVLDIPGGEINVFNLQGVWDLDGDNVSEKRRNMSNVIIKAITGKQNVIVAGDTNAKHTNPVMRAIEGHLNSVFGDELTTSFNMHRKDNPGYATAVVDMIYVSKNIVTLEHDCPDVDISDHLPLTAWFEISA